jgi:hypothetical protein
VCDGRNFTNFIICLLEDAHRLVTEVRFVNDATTTPGLSLESLRCLSATPYYGALVCAPSGCNKMIAPAIDMRNRSDLLTIRLPYTLEA